MDRWGYKYTEPIFNYLKPIAARCDVVFYSEVANEIGGSAQSSGGRELTAIQRECNDRGWPHLNALVVRKKDGLPGDGYKPDGKALSKDEFRLVKQEIYDSDWTDKHL